MCWLHSNNSKEDVDDLEAAFVKIISLIITILPMSCGGNYWKFPNMHGYMSMQKYVRIYVDALVFMVGRTDIVTLN